MGQLHVSLLLRLLAVLPVDYSLAKQLVKLNGMSPFVQAMSFLIESDIILSTVLSKWFLNLFTKRWLLYASMLSCFPHSLMYALWYLSNNWDTSVGMFFSITRLLTNAMRSFNAFNAFFLWRQIWFFWVFCVFHFVPLLQNLVLFQTRRFQFLQVKLHLLGNSYSCIKCLAFSKVNYVYFVFLTTFCKKYTKIW